MYTAVVWAVSLGCVVRVVLVDYEEALSFAFNASLTSVNLARAFARQQGMDLSVGSTKALLHNAAMVNRFIAMSGKRPNLRLNNTDFKELIFYGVRAVAKLL